ncbi:hypothetical protein B5S31_g3443 [[Candida] boidinii]|nr:hypothetical protein B5S29_g3419 [[Candida] boidinii]OWB73686.1 hypothetical protein B5S31_g3443 [[Candida] boidinii]
MLTDISNRTQFGYEKSISKGNANSLKPLSKSNVRVSQNNKMQPRRKSQSQSGIDHHNNASSINKKKLQFSQKQNTIDDYPVYNFAKFYNYPFESMFPFYTPKINESACKDGIDFTSTRQFTRNHVKKYHKPVECVNYCEVNTKNVDPIDKIFSKSKNGLKVTACSQKSDNINKTDFASSLTFGNKKITVDNRGTMKISEIPVTDTEPTKKETFIFHNNGKLVLTPFSPKKSVNFIQNGTPKTKMSASLSPSPCKLLSPKPLILNSGNPITTPSSLRTARSQQNLQSTLLKTLSSPTLIRKSANIFQTSPVVSKEKRNNKISKKKRKDRIDNSMTVSAKAIMKMVDDSLVSSDTDTYTQSFTNSIRDLNCELYQTGTGVVREPISINADDLFLAKNYEDEFDEFNFFSSIKFPSMNVSLRSKLQT